MAAASPRISKNKLEEGWQYLIDQEPDVAIVQEARIRGQIVGAVVEIPTCGDVVVISIHTLAKTLPKSEIPAEMLPIIKLKLNANIWRADIV
jgi:hypothetical protein